MWIDVTGADPRANALDIETGDAQPSEAGPWAAEHYKLTHKPGVLYSDLAQWPAVQASAHRFHVPVKYWIANPTGKPHLLPGADAVQWQQGKTIDITQVRVGFLKSLGIHGQK